MLAAGVGARLEKGADFPPKTLLRFGGKTLLQRHAEILRHCGIDELVMGVGHQAHRIRREIADLGIGDFVRTVDCPEFAKGAPYTMWGLRGEFNGPVLFMDGDVLYDHRLMARLLNSDRQTCFAIDRKVRPGARAKESTTVRMSRPGTITVRSVGSNSLHTKGSGRRF